MAFTTGYRVTLVPMWKIKKSALHAIEHG